MAFELPPLPYAPDALQPHITAKQFEFHHGKHHQAYITNLNKMVGETPELQGKSLEELIALSAGKADKAPLFNNAAQHWNHTFFWNSMKPNGGGAMPAALEARIVADFGSVEAFKEEFVKMGVGQFGSGWAWLVLDGGKLKVTKTANADLPMAHGQTALLTCDVWEHAYYIDYQNRRPDFLKAFVDSMANWDFALANLNKAA